MKTLHVNLWFICSVTLNAIGNSFMITANLGSAPWTSAAQNLARVLPISIGVCIMLLNFGAILLSSLLKIKLTLKTGVKSIALAFIFGFFIDVFIYLHNIIYIPENMWIRYLYLLIGINFIAISISIYFQLHSVYLPCDYLLKAFAKLKHNYTVGTIYCMSIPLSISLLIFLFQHHVSGLGIGTMFFIFGIGFLIDRYNRWITLHKDSQTNSLSG